MSDQEPKGTPKDRLEGEQTGVSTEANGAAGPKPPAGRGGAAFKRMGDAWMIAPILPAAIGIGYFAGRGLDHLLGVYPWCTAIFSTIGIAAGFREVIRIALRVGREEDEAARRGGRPR